MRALGFVIPMLLALLAMWYLTSDARQKRLDRRAFKRQKAAYLVTHPLHSGNEPIVWTCECGHTDNNHTSKGCAVIMGSRHECACFLTPREVRDRF